MKRKTTKEYVLPIFAVGWILCLDNLPQVRLFGLIGDFLGYRVISSEFQTVDDAGIASVLAINPTSIILNKEFGGKICSKNGKYFYTAPLEGLKVSLTVARSGLCPMDSKIVGDYHTHAASLDNDRGGELFSMPSKKGDLSNDIATNYYGYNLLWWNIPQQIGYLGTPTGRVMKFDPVIGDTYELVDRRWQVFQHNLVKILNL